MITIEVQYLGVKAVSNIEVFLGTPCRVSPKSKSLFLSILRALVGLWVKGLGLGLDNHVLTCPYLRLTGEKSPAPGSDSVCRLKLKNLLLSHFFVFYLFESDTHVSGSHQLISAWDSDYIIFCDLGWVAYVIIESPPVPIGLGFGTALGLGLTLRGPDLGLGLDN